MSVNKYEPHVYVLPEDDATRQIAVGFEKYLGPTIGKVMQTLPPAGGWGKVRKKFLTDYVNGMRRFPTQHVVLLIDFDEKENRLEAMTQDIPEEIAARVFVVGVWSEPEKLKSATGKTFETIGKDLAEDCRTQTYANWQHELLKHNANELNRMKTSLRTILFE